MVPWFRVRAGSRSAGSPPNVLGDDIWRTKAEGPATFDPIHGPIRGQRRPGHVLASWDARDPRARTAPNHIVVAFVTSGGPGASSSWPLGATDHLGHRHVLTWPSLGQGHVLTWPSLGQGHVLTWARATC